MRILSVLGTKKNRTNQSIVNGSRKELHRNGKKEDRNFDWLYMLSFVEVTKGYEIDLHSLENIKHCMIFHNTLTLVLKGMILCYFQ